MSDVYEIGIKSEEPASNSTKISQAEMFYILFKR